MSQTLGEKLRLAREERGISVSEVAEQTRISGHYLTCIENDDYRTLPGGIFNKGFVKSFAKCVGVDEQEALQDYATLVVQNDAGISDESRNYKPEVLTDDRTASSLIPTVIIAVIILGLMSWGLLKLVDYIQNQPGAAPVANSNANQTANVASANTQPTPAVSTNEIKVEFKAVSEKVSVEATVDGKKLSKEVSPDAPETYVGQESVRLRYYRGFADKVQLVINGKQVAPPPAPAKGNGVEFEVNKSNLLQIVQSGQITAPDAVAPNANKANINAAR
ncbi:MAG: helix-turn-helix domain-containing protein [Acidobacteria bacterium]|nr:helix-turn-helix domain-containing protein [Acidobacteriota bacterium]